VATTGKTTTELSEWSNRLEERKMELDRAVGRLFETTALRNSLAQNLVDFTKTNMRDAPGARIPPPREAVAR
jgi:hypothetical protein